MSSATEVISYAHLFDQCTQDWFSLASILEDLLTKLEARNPLIQRAYLKSDEAGCYRNSPLIAAVRDIAKDLVLLYIVIITQSHSLQRIFVIVSRVHGTPPSVCTATKVMMFQLLQT